MIEHQTKSPGGGDREPGFKKSHASADSIKPRMKWVAEESRQRAAEPLGQPFPTDANRDALEAAHA